MLASILAQPHKNAYLVLLLLVRIALIISVIIAFKIIIYKMEIVLLQVNRAF